MAVRDYFEAVVSVQNPTAAIVDNGKPSTLLVASSSLSTLPRSGAETFWMARR